MKCELWYSVVVRDRHGKIVSRERRKSKSFLKQWNQLVYVQVAQAALDITDTGGVARSVGTSSQNLLMAAAAGITDYGIRIGTGETPVAIDDYALETPIAEGVGAGEMNHLVCTVSVSAVAAPSCSFITSRSAVNNSGVENTVKEAGIYMRTGSYYVCATRDVFGVPQVVPDGGSLAINWTLRVTV